MYWPSAVPNPLISTVIRACSCRYSPDFRSNRERSILPSSRSSYITCRRSCSRVCSCLSLATDSSLFHSQRVRGQELRPWENCAGCSTNVRRCNPGEEEHRSSGRNRLKLADGLPTDRTKTGHAPNSGRTNVRQRRRREPWADRLRDGVFSSIMRGEPRPQGGKNARNLRRR